MMNPIQIEVLVNANIEKAWQSWNKPESIKQWCFASDDWTVGEASNDLRVGGRLSVEMKAKDGSAGFVFNGDYLVVEENRKVVYVLEKAESDAERRKVEVSFEKVNENQTRVVEIFDPENENSEELQRSGWQAILNNFKKFVER